MEDNETVEVDGYEYNRDNLEHAMKSATNNLTNNQSFAVAGDVCVTYNAIENVVYLQTVRDNVIITDRGVNSEFDCVVNKETVREKITPSPKEILEELVFDITTVEEFNSKYSDNNQFAVKHKNGLGEKEVDALIEDDRFGSMSVEQFGDECGVVITYCGE